MGSCLATAFQCLESSRSEEDCEHLFNDETHESTSFGDKSVSAYLSRRKKRRCSRRLELWELTERNRPTEVNGCIDLQTQCQTIDAARLAADCRTTGTSQVDELRSVRPGWRLGSFLNRFNNSSSSLNSCSSSPCLGSRCGSCNLEWDAEAQGFLPPMAPLRRGLAAVDDVMSTGRATSAIRSRDHSPSLEWDANFDSQQLACTDITRMTTSDVMNGNCLDDEAARLLADIDASTRRTLAETGTVLGFLEHLQ